MPSDTYVIKYKDTGKALLKRGKPVTLIDPTPEHLSNTLFVLSSLTGREVVAFKCTVHKLFNK